MAKDKLKSKKEMNAHKKMAMGGDPLALKKGGAVKKYAKGGMAKKDCK